MKNIFFNPKFSHVYLNSTLNFWEYSKLIFMTTLKRNNSNFMESVTNGF